MHPCRSLCACAGHQVAPQRRAEATGAAAGEGGGLEQMPMGQGDSGKARRATEFRADPVPTCALAPHPTPPHPTHKDLLLHPLTAHPFAHPCARAVSSRRYGRRTCWACSGEAPGGDTHGPTPPRRHLLHFSLLQQHPAARAVRLPYDSCREGWRAPGATVRSTSARRWCWRGWRRTAVSSSLEGHCDRVEIRYQ